MPNASENRIDLWDADDPRGESADEFVPFLQSFPAGDAQRGAVIVCPGGGYAHRADHEGEPIARAFNAAGIHGFVLQYRVAPNRYPAALQDVTRAVRLIRQQADAWHVDADRIAVCGFSAGGHLAASAGTLYQDPHVLGESDLDQISARPNALVLSYPVISSDPDFGHQGSFDNLLGADRDELMSELLSLELRVTPETPPTFLWHTVADPGVPIENAFAFTAALRRCRVPCECHFYPDGRHGLGLAAELPHVASWMPLCREWLCGMGF